MALPIASRTAAAAAAADQDWEICNDNGFVYKRRRLRSTDDPLPYPPPSSSRYRDADDRRAQKKKTLLSLRDKYRKELHQWEQLSASLTHLTAAVGPTNPPPAAPLPEAHPAPLVPLPSIEIQELLLQMETQEWIIGKLSELCDYVGSVCDAEEERMGKALMDLPVWGNPRCLVASLTSR